MTRFSTITPSGQFDMMVRMTNALQQLFSQWNDPEWLVDFFLENMSDLESYFKITDINQAIYDTIDDSLRMQCLILATLLQVAL